MMTLISCIFCHCQVPASASMAKYEEHLQVKLAVMIDCLITLAAHHHNRSASDWCRNKCDSSGMAQHNS